MTQITIHSDNDRIITDATMLKIKAEFCKKGIKTFPIDLIAEMCPYKQRALIAKFIKKASNVWHLRSSDKEIIQLFNKALSTIEAE